MTRPQRWRIFFATLAAAMAAAVGGVPAVASTVDAPLAAVHTQVDLSRVGTSPLAADDGSGDFLAPVYCGEKGAPPKPKCLKPIKAKVFNRGCNPGGGGDAAMLFVNPNPKGAPEAPRTIQVFRGGELFFQDDAWLPSGVSRLDYTGLGAYPTDPSTPAVLRIRIVKLGADEQVKIVFADKWLDFRGCPQGDPVPLPPPPADLAAAA